MTRRDKFAKCFFITVMLLVGHNSGSKNYVQYFYTNALNNVISKKSLMFQRNELNSYENTEYEELNATQV